MSATHTPSAVIAPWGTLEADCAAAVLQSAGVPCTPVTSGDATVVVAVETAVNGLLTVLTDARRLSGTLPLLVLARHADDNAVRLARSADAAGIIDWTGQSSCLVSAVRELSGGGRYYSSARRPGERDPVSELTVREQSILVRLAHGDHNDDIARTLGISPHTVRTHVQRVLGKLDVPNRHAAAALARRSPQLASLLTGGVRVLATTAVAR
ncbi:MAG: LuxR C-terminal-related transcriptional regulator [Actinomycetota bacterium]|nr:LuxR C-terminal-related transcriptional regulator [Actinomycetota bacterium]